jgi:nucleotide-binding universal stress UspA family protein
MTSIPKIDRILYATDLSEHSENAFRYAAAVADLSGARITVLHVVSDLPPNAEILLATILGYESQSELKRISKKELIQSIKAYLRAFCGQIANELPSCPLLVKDILVEEGKPVKVILDHINRSDCDLVIMGSRGHGLVTEALIGGTSRKVLKRSPKPVLIVPAML